jgi:hypothetical protein
MDATCFDVLLLFPTDVGTPYVQTECCPGLRALNLDCHFGHLMKFHPTPWIREPLLLTACNRVLLEKLTDSQLVNKLPAFHATRRFITAITTAHHLTIS